MKKILRKIFWHFYMDAKIGRFKYYEVIILNRLRIAIRYWTDDRKFNITVEPCKPF